MIPTYNSYIIPGILETAANKIVQVVPCFWLREFIEG